MTTMPRSFWSVGGIITALTSFWACSVEASPLAFDCDTVDGHYSRVTAVSDSATPQVSALVTPKRTGEHEKWAPSASISLTSKDEKFMVGLVLATYYTAPGSPRSKDLRMQIITRSGTDRTKEWIEAPIELNQSTHISIYLDESSRTHIRTNGREWIRDVSLGSEVTQQASCSTGQFYFENLEFGKR